MKKLRARLFFKLNQYGIELKWASLLIIGSSSFYILSLITSIPFGATVLASLLWGCYCGFASSEEARVAKREKQMKNHD